MALDIDRLRQFALRRQFPRSTTLGRAIARLLADLPVAVDWIDGRDDEFPEALGGAVWPAHIRKRPVDVVEREVADAEPGACCPKMQDLLTAAPGDMQHLAMAVSADALLRQRALVLGKLRQLGVDVIEAPWDRIGTRLLDSYLAIKRKGAIG